MSESKQPHPMSFEICKLKAGTTIIEARDGRIVADHPEDGLTIIRLRADIDAPFGMRVDITRAPQGVGTITAGYTQRAR